MSKFIKEYYLYPKNSGFTLIELLVVVLIIGILAAVALPKYQLATDKAKYHTGMNLVDAVARDQELYYLANGTYSSEKEIAEESLPAGFRVLNSSCYAKDSNPSVSNLCVGEECSYMEPWGGGRVQYVRYYSNSSKFPGARYCRVYLGAPDAERWKKLCASMGTPLGGVVWAEWKL